jgi:NDP-sugar pyrophosphorylase family protein
MQAIILAGGKGTRLSPYTTVLPKPLVPVGDYPILEILCRQLAKCGVRNVIITIGYHYELFQAFCGNGKKWGIELQYSLEDKPLGTVGPVKLIENLEDNFLIINGDTLTDLDYRELYSLHVRENNIMTIATSTRFVDIDYGVIKMENDGHIASYNEKPKLQYLVSMGVNVLSKKVLDIIPGGVRFDFPQLVLELLNRNMPVRSYVHKGYWLDIGRPEDHATAVKQFEENRKKFIGEDSDAGDVFDLPAHCSEG